MVVNLVTGNAAKAALLGASLEALGLAWRQVPLALDEPQAQDVEQVARAKAAQAAAKVGAPLLVEDAGLVIDTLRGFPGPVTRYALETIGAAGLVRLAAGAPCRLESVLVCVLPGGATRVLVDTAPGTIGLSAGEEAPDAWSDLWRIFVPQGADRPFALLPAAARAGHLAGRRQRWSAWLGEQLCSPLPRAGEG